MAVVNLRTNRNQYRPPSGAIQTRYKGYNMRSRTEARWAVLFDHCGIPWEYEKQGYKLDGKFYLPDFWLPTYKSWAEVKGMDYTEDEKEKCRRLCDHTKCPVIMLQETPEYDTGYYFYVPDYSEVVWDNTGFIFRGDDGRERYLEEAITAARSARFEFGEYGAT